MRNQKKTIIIDLEEIARLSDRDNKANFDFRAKLKWKTADEDRLDAKVQKLFKEISAQIDCRACGNCCKRFDIILSDDDIARLSQTLNLASDEFKHQFLKKAEDNDGPCFKAKPCPFLKDNQCSQYSARPEVCREYPHLDKPEFLGRTLGVIGSCATCPIVFNVWERLKNQ